jgi:hypothetical protein
MHNDIASSIGGALEGLASQDRRERLAGLIRCYALPRSWELACTVVRHLEALCAHPDDDRNPAECCIYRRPAQHWCWLARDLGPAAAQ